MIIHDERRWLLWRYVQKANKPKPVKVPMSIAGRYVDRHEPQYWLTFAEAQATYLRGGFDGVGFVLGGGYVGYDADIINDEVLAAVKLLDSYTETSPSGRGLHVILIGALPPMGRRKHPHELYDDQFFTFTGKHVEGTPIEAIDRAREVQQLHRQIFGDIAPTPTTDVPTFIHEGRRGAENITGIDTIRAMSNEEVLTLAATAGNNDKFQRLYSGDRSGYGDSRRAGRGECPTAAGQPHGVARFSERLTPDDLG